MKIDYYNRYTKKLETEKVYGEGATNFLYHNPFSNIMRKVATNPLISQLYGITQDSSLSAGKIPKFIKNFNIPINDFEKGNRSHKNIEDSYSSFNDFFTRKYKPNVRPFMQNGQLPAFAEGRYVGYCAIDEHIVFPVKGRDLNVEAMLDDSEDAKKFIGGPALICRLCPVDYHRYHYPADGKTLKHYWIKGALESVNPIALKAQGNIFLKNQRRVSILETQEFGKLAYIEVGAVCVGKIVQSFDESKGFKRGDEKGYFLFGGSTVVMIGEAGAWKPSADILDNTSKKIETYIHLGDEVGTSR